MKFVMLFSTSLLLSACTISFGGGSGSGLRTSSNSRPIPTLNEVREANLKVDDTSGLALTAHDAEYNDPILGIHFVDKPRAWQGDGKRYRPVLEERSASGDSAGLTKLGDVDLENVDLKMAEAAIETTGAVSSYTLTSVYQTAYDSFTPGSVWLVSKTENDSYGKPQLKIVVAVKLLSGWETSDEWDKHVRISYKVLEYQKL